MPRTPATHFQGCRQMKAFILAAKCNKRFIHSISMLFSALLRSTNFTSFHLHVISPFILHRTASVFRASYPCFFPPLRHLVCFHSPATYCPFPRFKIHLPDKIILNYSSTAGWENVYYPLFHVVNTRLNTSLLFLLQPPLKHLQHTVQIVPKKKVKKGSKVRWLAQASPPKNQKTTA